MHRKIILSICSFVGMLFVFGLINSNIVFATQTCTTDNNGIVTCKDTVSASVNVTSACSMSRTNGGSGEYDGGELTAGIAKTISASTFKVMCNDTGGYAIYAVGFSNNEFGNTNLISSNGTIGTDGSTSNWKMQLAADGTDFRPTIVSDYSTFHSVPNNYTKVAYYNSVTTTGNNPGSYFKTSYQVTASANQRAGEYTGKVKYVLVNPNSASEPLPWVAADCLAGKICYNINTYVSGSGNMGNQSASSNTETVLWTSNFKYPNHGFAGNTDTSICPKGWVLPIGGNTPTTSKSFSNLDYELGSTGGNQYSDAGKTQSKRCRFFPNNFIYSGVMKYDAGDDLAKNMYLDVENYYWSSASSSANSAFELMFGNSYFNPGTVSQNKYDGLLFVAFLAYSLQSVM